MLTRSANKGRLWLGLAAVAALAPGRTRRAAIRGVGALAASSLVVNTVLKPLARRPRPLIERTPVVRRLRRAPRTTSFPSGHAASAAAFTAGVAMEKPAGGAALAPLAAAVGYSRIHVGVHHLSDVVAGAALGAGVALATQRWWPVTVGRPAQAREYVPAPALPGGAGLLVVANPRSGNSGDPGTISDYLPDAEIVHLDPEFDLAAELDRRTGSVRALGAAGGDGTVATVAAVALRHELPLAVFPSGTFNHFAQDVGIGSFDDTAQAVAVGDAVTVDVAAVNDVPFLNTAVVGAYPEIVQHRDALTPRTGKWLAMAVAAGRVLRRQCPLRLIIDGKPVDVWTLFIGNCRYATRGPFPAGRPRLNDGWLDVQYLRADVPLSRTRAIVSTLAGVSRVSRAHPGLLVTELTVESRRGPVQIAHDGEPGEQSARFRLAKLPGSLAVYRSGLKS
jgi:undecaprenyl-diphosphatase